MVVSEMDEIFKIEHPDTDYQKLLVDKQRQLLNNAEESGIPVMQLL